MRKLTAPVLALTLVGVIGIAPIALLPTPVEAQAKKMDVRPEIREKVKKAQEDGQKGNYSAAISGLKAAKALGRLSRDEEYAINELLIWAANGTRDYGLMASTIEERLASGNVSGADRTRKLDQLAKAYATAGNTAKAIDAQQRLLAAKGGGSAEDLKLLGQFQFQRKDYRAAAGNLQKAVDAGLSGNSRVKALEMLNAAYFDLGDTNRRMQTLTRLVAASPKPDVFDQVVTAVSKEAGGDSVVLLNLFRLGAEKNMLAKDHYAKYADAALDLSSPGEAAAMLEKGMSNGGIKKDDRTTRLLAETKKQVDTLKAGLPQQEREAKALASGEGDARLATAYFTLKDYAKAAEAAKRGIDKGKLRRPDDAQMLLAIALAETRKSGEAKAAFQAAVKANPKLKSVADLWMAVGV